MWEGVTGQGGKKPCEMVSWKKEPCQRQQSPDSSSSGSCGVLGEDTASGSVLIIFSSEAKKLSTMILWKPYCEHIWRFLVCIHKTNSIWPIRWSQPLMYAKKRIKLNKTAFICSSHDCRNTVCATYVGLQPFCLQHFTFTLKLGGRVCQLLAATAIYWQLLTCRCRAWRSMGLHWQLLASCWLHSLAWQTSASSSCRGGDYTDCHQSGGHLAPFLGVGQGKEALRVRGLLECCQPVVARAPAWRREKSGGLGYRGYYGSTVRCVELGLDISYKTGPLLLLGPRWEEWQSWLWDCLIVSPNQREQNILYSDMPTASLMRSYREKPAKQFCFVHIEVTINDQQLLWWTCPLVAIYKCLQGNFCLSI